MRKLSSLLALALAAVFMIPFAVVADDLAELEFEKFELPNGLDVILHEDHSIPMVSVNVWYHVGSKNEKPGRTGFAHLFEHMMFQGSEHHNELFHTGIKKYGGKNNGSTSEDRTNYWENMPSNYLEKILWLEADRMGYLLPAVDQERLDLQRDVVMNERRERLDNQPYGKVEELLLSMLFPPEHPYSWHIIGSMDDLQAASLEDVKGFFRKYYSPNNASLCIAGDINPGQVRQWVEKYFGPIPPGPAIDRFETWIPELTVEKRMTAEDNINLARLYMAWHTPAYHAPGDAEFDLLASILASGKSSRLYKSLVYDKQIAQDVYAYQSSREIGSQFNIVATAKEGQSLAEIEQEIDRIIADVLNNGISQEELGLAKVNWEAGFVRGLQNIGGFGGRADRLNRYNVYLGNPGMLLWDRDRYRNANAEDILAYAKRYLKPDARAVLHIYPHGDLKADAAEINMAIEPSAVPDPSFTPPAIQKGTLSNGLEIMLVEDHKLPLVQVNLLIKSGWASDPTDRPGAGALTADMLNEGTKSKNALDISDEARRLGANFGTDSYFDYSHISLNVLKDNIDPALALMADIVLNPIFPDDELERLKENYLGRIRQEASQPMTTAFKMFYRELYGEDHPYGQPYTGTGTVKSINAITIADLKDYYNSHYLPNNAVAVVVGDISLSEATGKLEKAFKKWKSGNIPQQGIKPVETLDRTRICLVDKPGAAQSVIVVGQLALPRNHEDYTALEVANHVLGGQSMARLYMNLRQDKGYTYGAYSFLTSRRGPGVLACYSQVQTEFTKESLMEFLKELNGMRGEIPLSPQELEDSKNNLVKGFPQDFQSFYGIAEQVNSIATFGLPGNEWSTYVNDINSVDTDKALQMAQKYIHPDKTLIVIVGDREKIEPGIRELGLGEIVYLDSDEF